MSEAVWGKAENHERGSSVPVWDNLACVRNHGLVPVGFQHLEAPGCEDVLYNPCLLQVLNEFPASGQICQGLFRDIVPGRSKSARADYYFAVVQFFIKVGDYFIMIVSDGQHPLHPYPDGFQGPGYRRGVRVYNLAYEDFVPDSTNRSFSHCLSSFFSIFLMRSGPSYASPVFISMSDAPASSISRACSGVMIPPTPTTGRRPPVYSFMNFTRERLFEYSGAPEISPGPYLRGSSEALPAFSDIGCNDTVNS